MATRSSTLDMRLIDNVTGPSTGVNAALGRTRAAASGFATGARGAAASAGMLGTSLESLLVIAAGYLTLGKAKEAYMAFAAQQQELMRLGFAANATQKQVDAAHEAMFRLAMQSGVAHDQIGKAMKILVTGTGRSLEDAQKLLPVITMVHNATGASMEGIAKTTDAMTRIMDIAPSRLSHAWEMLGVAAHDARVSMEDVNANMPKLMEVAKRAGETGEGGLQRLLAVVMALSKRTVDGAEAFRQVEAVIMDVTGTRAIGRFKKMGVDIWAELNSASKKGWTQMEAVGQAIWKAIGGNFKNLPKLFPTEELQLAARNFLESWREVPGAFRAVGSASDEMAGRAKTASESAAADAERVKTAWHEVAVEFGKLFWRAGAAGGLGELGSWYKGQLEKGEQAIDQYLEQRRKAAETAALQKRTGMPYQEARAQVEAGRRDAVQSEIDRKTAELDRLDQRMRRTIGPPKEGDVEKVDALVQEIHSLQRRLTAYDEAIGTLKAAAVSPYKPYAPELLDLPGVSRYKPYKPELLVQPSVMDKIKSGEAFSGAKEAGSTAGAQAGRTFIDNLASQIDAGTATIQQKVNRLLGILNFNASPTVTPNVTPQALQGGNQRVGGAIDTKARGGYWDGGKAISI